MGEVAVLNKGASLSDHTLTANQLKIIKNSIAPGLTPTEFDLFIEQCKIYGLNPITKQIYAVVYMRNKKVDGEWVKDRQLTLITSISGLRAIANRTGRYRPDGKAARFERCDVTTANPKGLETAYVSVYTQDNRGNWHEVEEAADWDEFAPLYDGAPSGKWGEMPKVMLSKCAEARALRKAFPELEGLYSEDEMDQANMRDVSASEALEAQETLDRRALVGEKHIVFTFDPMGEQEAIPSGKVAGRLDEFYGQVEPLDKLEWFLRCNKEALKQFWAECPTDALEMKACREKREKQLHEIERSA